MNPDATKKILDNITPMEDNKTGVSSAHALLANVGSIIRYNNQFLRISGEHFNIFRILQIERKEVTTHSRFLAEMLSPNGCHYQKDTFLKLFLKEIKIEGFDSETATVNVEVSTAENGRVDILIQDRNGRIIVIENKIDAGLQYKQLERYRDAYEKADLIFLTLDGSDSGCSKDIVVKNISYKNEINRWLEACKKEACDMPTIREAIAQYAHLIRKITNQDTSSIMEKEIISAVLFNHNSLEAYVTLNEHHHSIRASIIKEINDALKVATPSGCKIVETFEGKGSKGERITFSMLPLEKYDVRISFEFDAANYSGFSYGFRNIKGRSLGELEDLLKKNWKAHFGNDTPKSNAWWSAWQWAEKEDWPLNEIKFGNFVNYIIDKVKKMQSIAEESLCDLEAAKEEPTPSA